MKDILKTIGNTPSLVVDGIYVKWEGANPTGSIKDRIADFIVRKNEENGTLKKGDVIVEATSGNTGVSFAFIAAVKGYRMKVVIPEGVGGIKRRLIKALGGEVLSVSKEKGFRGAIEKTKRMAEEQNNVFLPSQFENKDNLKTYEVGLAPEILREKTPSAFVAGIGTGGTLMGVGRALKKVNKKVMVIGIEAEEKDHKIGGISDGIAPPLLDYDLIDDIYKIKSREAIKMSRWIVKNTGLLVGVSSGANLLAAQKLGKRYGIDNIATVFPDRAERYPELW